jgi:hypothetical protein
MGMFVGLAGCGSQETQKYEEMMTRAMWIDMLAAQYNLNESYSQEPFFTDIMPTNPYFQEIQACVEWEIIEISDEFRPHEEATTGFAVVTAIRAIGLDRLERSDYNADLKTEDDILAFFNTQSGLSISADNTLTRTQAIEIVEKTQEISNGLTLPQIYKVEYKDNVRLMNLNQVMFSADGETATMSSGSVNIGDVIVIEPNRHLPRGKYARVMSVSGNDITYEEVELEDFVENFEMQGTFFPTPLAAIPFSSGVEIIIDSGTAVNPMNYDASEHLNVSTLAYVSHASNGGFEISNLSNRSPEITFKIGIETGRGGPIRGEGSINGSVTINNIRLTTDVSVFTGRASVMVDYDIVANVSINGELYGRIPAGRVDFGIVGITGLSLEGYIKIGVEGEISFDFLVANSSSIDVRPFRRTKSSNNSNLRRSNVDFKAKAYVRPGIEISLFIGTWKLSSIGAFSGVNIEMKAADYQGCYDGIVYIPMVGYFKYKLTGLISGEFDFRVWHKGNSPFQRSFHMEGFVIVPECTKGGETDADFEDDDFLIDMTGFDYLALSANFVALNPNITDKLHVTRMPDGYTADDLVFTSDNRDVVIIDNTGTFTTVGEGVAMIRVATRDGEYERFCIIVSLPSFAVDFTPLL